MIPPDLLERAREAFAGPYDRGNGWAAYEAAERVFAAAWPEADGRLREAAERWVASFWTPDSTMDGASPEAQALVRIVLDLPALPTAPAADVRIVRVAVAADGDDHAQTWVFQGKETADAAWRWAHSAGYPIRLCIAEIPVPIRDVPTVRASVEAPDA